MVASFFNKAYKKAHTTRVFQSIGGSKARYEEQQDSVLCQDLIQSPTPDDFKELFRKMEGHFLNDEKMRDSGSTVSLAVVDAEGWLTMAYVGDSPISIGFRDRQTGQVNLQQLTKDHSPDEPEEYKNLIQRGGYVNKRGYVEGRLNMTRSMGDFQMQTLRRDPEIQRVNLKPFLEMSDEVFLIVECDGLHEKTFHSERQSALNSIKNYNKIKKKHLINRLVSTALNNGSSDNISIAVSRLEGVPANPFILGMFDGHGDDGAYTSQALKEFVSEYLGKVMRPEPNKADHKFRPLIA